MASGSVNLSYIELFQKFAKYSSGDRHSELSPEVDLICWYKKASSYVENFLRSQPSVKQSSVIRALLLGGLSFRLRSESMSAAFYVGYQLAIKALFDTSLKCDNGADDRLFSYCVTESAGNGPKHIAASLQTAGEGQWMLNGVKTFVTAPDIATDYLVVVSAGWKEQQNQLRLLHLDRAAIEANASADLKVFPALPFLSSIRHGSLSFKDFLINDSQVLEGEAYSRYVKPFRWYEDLHVFSAIFGMLSIAACQVNDDDLLSQMLVLCSATSSLSCVGEDYDYLQFAGLQSLFMEMDKPITSMLRELDPAMGEMWMRDRKLFDIAKDARRKRAEIARKQFLAI